MSGRWDRLAVGLATVGPFGFTPIAPGTAGSVAGLAVFWALRSTGSIWVEAVGLVLVCLVGVAAATRTEARYGRTDPGVIVIDEVAMLSEANMDWIVAMWKAAGKQPCLVLSGDLWQMPGPHNPPSKITDSVAWQHVTRSTRRRTPRE